MGKQIVRYEYFDLGVTGDYNTGRYSQMVVSSNTPIRWETLPQNGSGVSLATPGYRVPTGCGSRAARLFLRLFEMVRSIMAPQLMHFHA